MSRASFVTCGRARTAFPTSGGQTAYVHQQLMSQTNRPRPRTARRRLSHHYDLVSKNRRLQTRESDKTRAASRDEKNSGRRRRPRSAYPVNFGKLAGRRRPSTYRGGKKELTISAPARD